MIQGRSYKGGILYSGRGGEPDEAFVKDVFKWFSGVLNDKVGVQAGKPREAPFKCDMGGDADR